ncbi:MAG: hypothetical protein KAX31_05915 [Thermoplasmata archaeon]|nr:hypothetical protein [Thermoplasmata archaeon]
MPEMWIHGKFFRQTLEFMLRKRGKQGLKELGQHPDDYLPERKYEFEEFCQLLIRINETVADGEPSFFPRIAREMLTKDTRWQMLFRRLDPKDVLTSMKRQEGQYQVSSFEPEEVQDNHVTLRMSMWGGQPEHQEIWAEFYKGRLEGILELTGHKGTVEVVGEGKGEYLYTIDWA